MSDLIFVDGERVDSIPITDSTVLRGDGCFEAVRSYGGRLFALEDHLDRLERSAASLELPAPARDSIVSWCTDVASELGDGIVRVVMSRGDAIPSGSQTPRYVVVGHSVGATPADLSLARIEAPWHPAGRGWSLAGAKTVSYAPNLSASRAAQAAGAHDALLVSSEGVVLEGPTFSVAWVVDGVLETAGLDLLVLDSITRRRVLSTTTDLGIPLAEGRYTIDRLDEATEVMVMSTVKEVSPVRRIDDRSYPSGPLTGRLASAFAAMVEREIS